MEKGYKDIKNYWRERKRCWRKSKEKRGMRTEKYKKMRQNLGNSLKREEERRKKETITNNISREEWRCHFKEILEETEEEGEDRKEETQEEGHSKRRKEGRTSENTEVAQVIRVEEMWQAVKRMKRGKAAGVDEISTWFSPVSIPTRWKHGYMKEVR